ncbi:hypothetical protein FRC07_013788 [Ceratobasidium sp. 392]|nr:hypothetical protein FRC07_013788 [Ceratobasidium sp. 392]
MVETEEIWLSHLKFAGLKPRELGPDIAVTENNASSTGRQNPNFPSAKSHTPHQSLPATINLKPYERIAAEKPGEELAPDAAIWEMYVEEARQQDSELVDGKNGNLDQMLLFATLFSAILTAFIIESKNLLQQDSADLTVTLLLAIAQSQQRVEQGTPQTLPPIDRPPFSAPMSARWITGLWYTALGLSLSSALVAMLAKEWLGSFLASRPRPPQAYALEHQTRLQGLFRWKAIHIIDLLPAMLHLSLLLFSLGLTLYLRILDPGAAITVVIITIVTALFYLGTALLGALREACPFDTQFSKYLRMVFNQFSISAGAPSSNEDIEDIKLRTYTTDNEICALVWLAKHARDPTIGDCAYQALAGLRIPRAPIINPVNVSVVNADPDAGISVPKLARLITALNGKRPNQETDELLKSLSARHTILNGLCNDICTRLGQAIPYQPRDLTTCLGTNVARYAGALPMLVRSLETYVKTSASVTGNALSKLPMESQSSARLALASLDSIWSNDCPELHPDSYAMLVGADLRVIEAIVSIQHSEHNVQATSNATSHVNEISEALSKHSSIQIDSPFDPPPAAITGPTRETSNSKQVSLVELRARYSRMLSRASFCLIYHNDGQAPIGSHSITYLLDSMHLASQCAILNPKASISTHQPQSEGTDTLPLFNVHAIGTGLYRILAPMSIIGDKDGPLGGLIGVLSASDIETAPLIEYAAGRTLGTIGPLLIRQWIQTNDNILREYWQEQPQVLEYVYSALDSWPTFLEAENLSELPYWTLSQLLAVTVISIVLADNPYPYGNVLPQVAASALYRRAKVASGRYPLLEVLWRHKKLVENLIDVLNLKYEHLSQITRDYLLRLFLVQYDEDSMFASRRVPATRLTKFLQCLHKWPGRSSEVYTILKELRDLLEKDLNLGIWVANDRYILPFISEIDGFACLASLSQHQEYTDITIECIKSVTTFAMLNIHTYGWSSTLLPCAVPGLLDCALIVLRNVIHDTENLLHISAFICEVVALLDSLDTEGITIAADYPAMEEIHVVLMELPETHPNIASMAAKVEEIQGWAGPDGRMLVGLARLFEQNQPGKYNISYKFGLMVRLTVA